MEQLACRHTRWDVFSDFVELASISISNAVDLVQREAREARYEEIVKRYAPDELTEFPQMLGELVLAFEAGFDDPLGRVFHDLELHNRFQGQFFTPFELCRAMAGMTINDRVSIERAIASRGFITALEPACGGGAMMIALAEALKDSGINYQRHLHVTCVDVDRKCAHMTYVQLSLLHVPAVVVHGNSLSLEEHGRWYTPAHVFGGWSQRLRAAAEAEGRRVGVDNPAAADASVVEQQLSLLEAVA